MPIGRLYLQDLLIPHSVRTRTSVRSERAEGSIIFRATKSEMAHKFFLNRRIRSKG